ncbi:hypothetical protein WJX75_005246 [Coccomyxa subellipsoidea]|uniref:Uncharacterized protein n=1 Tax=Coccomyxa subellipsoidea TaxID=248742 RepID=A0ABR2YQ55_9CHLO
MHPNQISNTDRLGTLTTFLLRFATSNADMDGTSIMLRVVSHTFQYDEEIKKALQFAAANRIQINFCAIPDNTEGGMQEDLADFAASILDADHATLTCCSNGSSVMCMCSVTNNTIRTADCAPDPSYVQIAPGSILHLTQHSAVSSKITPPAEWDGQLAIITRVKVEDVSETVLFGCCHVLTGDDAKTFGDEIFFSALCQELRERDEALIAHTKWDFSAARATSVPLFYVLFPASNTSALLIRRFACREEIYSSASEQPESAPTTPEAQADVRSLLGSIPCPVFCPLDYSNNSAKLLQALVADSIPMPAAPPVKNTFGRGFQGMASRLNLKRTRRQ